MLLQLFEYNIYSQYCKIPYDFLDVVISFIYQS